MLFGPEAKEKFEREVKGLDSDTLAKDYETVNEGDTTDTTEAFDNEILLTRTGKDNKVSSEEKKKQSKKAVEEGIKSSSDDDEGNESAAAKAEEIETRKMTFTEETQEDQQKDEV